MVSSWQVDGAAAVRLPGVGDVVKMAVHDGYADMYGDKSVDELDLSDGTVWVNSGGSLDLEVLNIGGTGRLALSAAKTGLPAGVVNVSGNATLADNGLIDRFGSVRVGPGGTFTQSGGGVTSASSIFADTYSLTGATAVMDGKVDAAKLFALNPDGDMTISGQLIGTGDLVKSGDGTVILTGLFNDFTGDIRVEGGVLQKVAGYEAPVGDIHVDAGAVFRATGEGDSRYSGSLTGEGTFEKTWDSQFGIGSSGNPDDPAPVVDMGGLMVTGGTFRIGTRFLCVDDGATYGGSIDARFRLVKLGDEVSDNHEASGSFIVEHGSTLAADRIEITGGQL